MPNKEGEQRGLMRDAHILKAAWLFQLMNQNSFVLSPNIAKLDVTKQQLAILFGIPINAQEKMLKEDASLLVTGHGEGWTVAPVRLDEMLGRQHVTAVKKAYQLLLEYIEAHYGEVDLHLKRQEATRLYNDLPHGTQQDVTDPETAFSIIPNWE